MTSTVTCAKFSSYPRIANGKIVFMPMSIGTKAAGAYQTTPNIPSTALVNIPSSVVRCTITPLAVNVALKGFVYDFEPMVTSNTLLASGANQASDVTVGPVRSPDGSSGCDCSGFAPENIVQCTCTTTTTYYFDITANAGTIKESNPHTFNINVNGIQATALTNIFDVNYPEVRSDFQAEIGCQPSQGVTSPNHAVSNRFVNCKGIIKDSTGVVVPANIKCMQLSSVTTSGNLHVPTFGSLNSIDGVGFSFMAIPNEVGMCDGQGLSSCSYRIAMTTGSGSTCGVTPYQSGLQTLVVNHGTPSSATSVSCSTPAGLSSGNVRIGGTATCQINPADAYGPITCCNGGVTAFSIGATSGTTGALSSTNNGRQITYTYTATNTIPTSPSFGTVIQNANFGGVALSTSTINVVDFPTEVSSMACTPSKVATLQKVTCTVYVRNANGNTTADPLDFNILPVDAATFGVTSVITSRPTVFSYLNRTNTEMTFTLTAGKVKGTSKNITLRSYYKSTAPTTMQTNLTLLDATYNLVNSPSTFEIVYGVPTTASTLDCASVSTARPEIEALGTSVCTVTVNNELGATTVDPSSPPFVAAIEGAMITSMSSADAGATFTFTATASDVVANNIVNVSTTLSAALGQGKIVRSPTSLFVVYRPTILSTMSCSRNEDSKIFQRPLLFPFFLIFRSFFAKKKPLRGAKIKMGIVDNEDST